MRCKMTTKFSVEEGGVPIVADFSTTPLSANIH